MDDDEVLLASSDDDAASEGTPSPERKPLAGAGSGGMSGSGGGIGSHRLEEDLEGSPGQGLEDMVIVGDAEEEEGEGSGSPGPSAAPLPLGEEGRASSTQGSDHAQQLPKAASPTREASSETQ